MKDPYPEEVRGTVEAVCEQLGSQPTRFAYQSQGRSGEKWLGPSVEETLAELAQEGHRHVLVAPIGFICDHVETLYDIDIELNAACPYEGHAVGTDTYVERLGSPDRYYDIGDRGARILARSLAAQPVARTPKSVVIVGGGISGLSTAFALLEQAAQS